MELGFYHLGNGITVCDKHQTEDGDYKCVAHIDKHRIIKWMVKPNAGMRKEVEAYAASADPCVSYTQNDKVFTTRV